MMRIYEIMAQGSCAITRRMAEIESIWEEVLGENEDVTGHHMFEEYERLLDSLCCIALGMQEVCGRDYM